MPIDYDGYRESHTEQLRIFDLRRILPKNRESVLDIGARDGYISRVLTEYFERVVALDLELPKFEIPGVVTVQGNVTRLEFQDSAFEVVCCLEVLEHIPPQVLSRACLEIARVARHEAVISVPYRQVELPPESGHLIS